MHLTQDFDLTTQEQIAQDVAEQSELLALTDSILEPEQAEFVFDENSEDLPYLRTVVSDDHEQERWITVKAGHYVDGIFGPEWVKEEVELDISTNTSDMPSYWTTTGNNPVIQPLAHQGDVNRLLNEIEAPDNSFYYEGTEGAKARYQNYLTYAQWIYKHRSEPELLREGWKKFWKRYFGLKAKNDLLSWLTKKQISDLTYQFKLYNSELGKK